MITSPAKWLAALRGARGFRRAEPDHGSPECSQSRAHEGAPRWLLRSAISTLKVLQVRLRIPAILVISALIVGRWEAIRNYWDSLTRSVTGDRFSSHAVSNDTEYFCPMDPGVVSDWPGKCGICNMALVRRKRGEAVALPDGVVARMQVSPYRIQLAGIRTAPLGFRPLERTYETAGIVRRRGPDLIVPLELSARSAPWIADGQFAQVRSKELGDGLPIAGRLELRGGEDNAQNGPNERHTQAYRAGSGAPARHDRRGAIRRTGLGPRTVPLAPLRPACRSSGRAPEALRLPGTRGLDGPRARALSDRP